VAFEGNQSHIARKSGKRFTPSTDLIKHMMVIW